MKVSDALTQFGYLKKDIADIGLPTFLQWCNIINRFAYRIIRGIDPERYILSVPYSTISGTGAPSVQALPTDFENVLEWNTGFFMLDGNGNITNSRLSLTSPSQQSYGYYINGNSVYFTNPSDKSYTLRYIPKAATMTALGDTFVIPDEYSEYILRALDAQYSIWDEDMMAEIGSDNRFINVLNELAENIKKSPDAFDLPDFSGNFGPSGSSIGYPGY